jgi:membrane-associated protease RseP (regulator of RpoE activity)
LGDGTVEVSLAWAAVATASVVALAVAAPGGLLLLGFLGLVIAVHEAGHFAVARRAGMAPTEFFWGFGPVVAAVRVGACRYGVRALFLGGYVKLEGMTPRSSLPAGFPESGTYRAASHRGRLATILAGAGVNLVTAVVAFTAASLVEGRAPLAALADGFGDLWYVLEATARSLWLLAANAGQYVEALVGGPGAAEAPVRFMSPVAQAEVSRRAVSLGPVTVLRWFGVLSAAIGAINLVPLPPLDGGHAAATATEWLVRGIRRDRTISLDVGRLVPLAYVTVGLLLALALSALVLDLRDLA